MKNRIYVVTAVLLGFLVIGWMAYKDFDLLDFSAINISWRFYVGLFLAILFFSVQNFCMMSRFRLLTKKILSWKQSFRVNMLCEFTSAITPSSVGGSGLIFLYLYKEGMNVGRSTAIMIASLFLDELFLCSSCLLAVLFFPLNVLFGHAAWITSSVKWIFMLVVIVVALWTLFLYVSLFCRPQWVRSVLLVVFSLPLLRRLRSKVENLANDLVLSSKELSCMGFSFWLKSFGLTALSWCFRYAVAVALLFAFCSKGNLWLAYARQWVLWMISIVSPTPGGSGLNEFMFKVYYADFFPSNDVTNTLLVVVLWRLITYYSYLLAGVSIVPQWIRGIKSK